MGLFGLSRCVSEIWVYFSFYLKLNFINSCNSWIFPFVFHNARLSFNIICYYALYISFFPILDFFVGYFLRRQCLLIEVCLVTYFLSAFLSIL